MNDYQIFKQIIRDCSYDNTYKMAWAKALVEISTEINLDKEMIIINLQDIAKKYIKYYWNQTIFFDLVQGSNPYKPPKILTYVKRLIDKYKKISGSNLPELYEKVEIMFDNPNLKDSYKEILRLVKDTLKIDVSWRFLNLGKDKYQIYSYNKGDDYLLIKRELLQKFRDNEQDLYDLINYKWGLILETFNNSPKINKKVKIMDEREIKRSNLNKFRKYLDLENKEHICFYCNSKIEDDDLSIDHVIPWSYMYSDDIWNLVYVHKNCNSIKSNRIPKEDMINKLKIRNNNLLKKMEDSNIKDKNYYELKISNNKDYVTKFWIGSKN